MGDTCICIFFDLLLEEMGKEREVITQEMKSIQGAKESTHMTNAVNLQYNYMGKGEVFRSITELKGQRMNSVEKVILVTGRLTNTMHGSRERGCLLEPQLYPEKLSLIAKLCFFKLCKHKVKVHTALR